MRHLANKNSIRFAVLAISAAHLLAGHALAAADVATPAEASDRLEALAALVDAACVGCASITAE